jgi:class 3 adenylate cyclase
VSDVDDLVAAGLYDPEATDAAQRLALLEYLLSLGISLPEIRQAHDEDRMLSLAAIRQLRQSGTRLDLSAAARDAEVSVELARRIWRAAGFADPRPRERRFGPEDVEVLRTVAMIASLVGEEQAVLFVRTLGQAATQIAEAEVAMLRSEVESPLAARQEWAEVARTYAEITGSLFPRISVVFDTLHRHHIEGVGRRYSDVGARPSPTNTVHLGVGFADLAGYTGLSQRLDARELGRLLSTFESVTGDVIAAAGAHVVKRIGDAVMFVSNAPGITCAVALELVEECVARRLPKLRVGLAFGEVVVRQGDFYGPTVNLAARLVAAAPPGVVLCDLALQARLARLADRYVFHPIGRLDLAGFDGGADAFQVFRP